jgi:hypothetical protein
VDEAGRIVAKARVKIVDAATQNILWNSDRAIGEDGQEPFETLATRTVRATSVAGVNVVWEPVATAGAVGYGYAMTATVGGGSTGDLDGSGAVDGPDLAMLLAGWGPCPPAPTPSNELP